MVGTESGFVDHLSAVRARRSAQLLAELEECVEAIVAAVNKKKDHIPPVVSSQAVTFPFEIAIRGCALSAPLTGAIWCFGNEYR